METAYLGWPYLWLHEADDVNMWINHHAIVQEGQTKVRNCIHVLLYYCFREQKYSV